MKDNSILIVLPILTVLMFDLGLTLRVSDFVRIVKRPKAMILGLVGQLLILPLIALALGKILGLPAVFFIGLLLIACCPGGSSSNVFSMLAKGDVALSVSLTAFSSIITLFTLPVVMQYATARLGSSIGVTLPVGKLLVQNIITMLLPIIAGITVRHFWEKAAGKIDAVLSKCAFPALMLLAGIFFVQKKTEIIANIGSLGVAAGALIIASVLVAALAAVIFRLSSQERRTIVIEVGMQNAAQAIALAVSPFVFNNKDIAIPAIVYALLMNVVLLTYVGFIKWGKFQPLRKK